MHKSLDNIITFTSPEYDIKDGRGHLKQLFSKGWNQINVIYSKKGVVRGNHYHKINNEFFYVISGSFKLTLTKDNIKKIYEIKHNDMFIIHPNTSHSFEFLENTQLVSGYDVGVISSDGSLDIIAT